MGFMTDKYAEYLASDAWKLKRKQRIEASGNRCESCKRNFRLQVHHLTYRNIFNEPLEDLMTLCHYHHAAAEECVHAGMIGRNGDVGALRLTTLLLLENFGKPLLSQKEKKEKRKEELLDRQSVPKDGMVTLTKKLIKFAGTSNCGWNSAQLGIVGVESPPRKGWMKRLVGKQISEADWKRFRELARKPKV